MKQLSENVLLKKRESRHESSDVTDCKKEQTCGKRLHDESNNLQTSSHMNEIKETARAELFGVSR